tara:strand:+ start:218 stop:886 length:669 start_codon:yes stop_codon:yes gene_type:complete
MKRFITILLSFLFISFQSAKAEFGVGITGALHMFDASGTETTRSSGEKNNGSHSEDALVPELFLEAFTDNGAAIGISYIPTRDIGSKSRTDSNPTAADSGNDAGTYTAKAELDNVIQFYVDYPFAEAYGASIYGKVGIQHATISTLESLNSGSTYPNEDVLGLTLGVGAKGDLPYGNNLYYKAEAAFTDFEDYSENDEAGTGNKVEAELEDISVKLSVGYKF